MVLSDLTASVGSEMSEICDPNKNVFIPDFKTDNMERILIISREIVKTAGPQSAAAVCARILFELISK